MKQPNNYGFEEEAALLKDSARRFFAAKLPVNELHALVAGEPEPERGPACAWRAALWDDMVELGWTALAVPESEGGLGMPWVAVCGLLEEAGRAAFPSPLLSTLCATALLAECDGAAGGPLAEIAAGKAATLAVMDAAGNTEPGAVRAVNGVLEGEACYVQDPAKCSWLLVVAREDAATSLYWCPIDAEGVSVAADAIVDLTRDQGRVRFSGVRAQRLDCDGAAAWAAALPIIWVLCSADMVGAAEWQLQATVDYAGQREQFDRPLGFFQAVKHALVNVMVSIDESRSLLYSSACALNYDAAGRAQRLAHMAKASASDTAGFASSRAVQCHGGIGFTWEAYQHLYFKRQQHSQRLWGDGAWHRAALAELLIDTAS